MERLWSPAGAISGNQRQIESPREPRKQAKSVAAGCHWLPLELDGKEGVDGSRCARRVRFGRFRRSGLVTTHRVGGNTLSAVWGGNTLSAVWGGNTLSARRKTIDLQGGTEFWHPHAEAAVTAIAPMLQRYLIEPLLLPETTAARTQKDRRPPQAPGKRSSKQYKPGRGRRPSGCAVPAHTGWRKA